MTLAPKSSASGIPRESTLMTVQHTRQAESAAFHMTQASAKVSGFISSVSKDQFEFEFSSLLIALVIILILAEGPGLRQ